MFTLNNLLISMHKMLYSNHITTVTFLILCELSYVEMVPVYICNLKLNQITVLIQLTLIGPSLAHRKGSL